MKLEVQENKHHISSLLHNTRMQLPARHARPEEFKFNADQRAKVTAILYNLTLAISLRIWTSSSNSIKNRTWSSSSSKDSSTLDYDYSAKEKERQALVQVQENKHHIQVQENIHHVSSYTIQEDSCLPARTEGFEFIQVLKFKKTNTTLAHYTIQEGSCLPARTEGSRSRS